MPSRLEGIDRSSEMQLPVVTVDSTLQKIQDLSFDPVTFLNNNLGSFPSSSGQQSAMKSPKTTQMQETSSYVQGLISKLNGYHVRYSNTLTQLTDEILRSGSRLAYEVEILRGDANGLYDALINTLQDDIQRLVISEEVVPQTDRTTRELDENAKSETSKVSDVKGKTAGQDPEFISQLRMLSQVKARLEEVINVFGEAMGWPLPPSELSITSSLISVSAPEPGSESHTREEKGREMAKKLRSEIIHLLDGDGGGYSGIHAASARVEALRQLAGVWKGTAEEKARNKLVDGLAKLVDERQKALDAHSDPARQRLIDGGTQRSSSMPSRPLVGHGRTERNAGENSNTTGGLLRNLQRLRDEIYLD